MRARISHPVTHRTEYRRAPICPLAATKIVQWSSQRVIAYVGCTVLPGAWFRGGVGRVMPRITRGQSGHERGPWHDDPDIGPGLIEREEMRVPEEVLRGFDAGG